MSVLHDHAIDRTDLVADALRKDFAPDPAGLRHRVPGPPPIDPGTWVRSVDGSWHRAPEPDPSSILLAGDEAQQYRALQAAARNAAATAKAAQTAAGELRDAFQAFCAATTKET